MDTFSKKIENVKNIITQMIENSEKLPRYMSVEQLNMTVNELDKMNQIRNKNEYMPYYPRGIADSWDYNDNLGNELLRILDVYVDL